MNNIAQSAIKRVLASKVAFCRFITANDTGSTGSHQSGIYIPRYASSLLFDKPGVKGENKERTVRIVWQDNITTESCMKYYGQGTRNEYRITKFGRNFPFLTEEHTGDLLILAQLSTEDYAGYVLSHDDEIDSFLAYFNIPPTDTNRLIDASAAVKPNKILEVLINEFVEKFDCFPQTDIMAKGARFCYNNAYNVADASILSNPDDALLHWLDTEFILFKEFERKIYNPLISQPFGDIESFIVAANQVLNRRKSRAGKSLEHHLANIFTTNNLVFEAQAVTENNKKPDFLFPNGSCYHNFEFPADCLSMLGVKTTCKDRWRQILSEADRINEKFLFTTQAALSKNQLSEMQDSNVILVVPKGFISNFAVEFRDNIHSLADFIQIIKNRQSMIPKHYIFN